MSATASFTRLARADLSELVEAANDEDPQAFMSYLAANGTSVADYDWDGDVFEVLLPVLAEEYDIDLETSENALVADLAEAMEAMVVILTAEDKAKYLALLSPENFTKKELREAYEDFAEEDEEEAGDMMLEGITALHTALGEADADHVVVLSVN
ncbi:MAG: hypothetical protein POG74_07945 [Acidocella sp.]|nr:hypothetical protein [Acidocella sp.]